MAEYIKREAAFNALTERNLVVHMDSVNDGLVASCHRSAQRVIANIPAADVVEVVRCFDCEYYDRNDEARLDKGCYFCSCFGGYTRPTFYCAAGERKGGDE